MAIPGIRGIGFTTPPPSWILAALTLLWSCTSNEPTRPNTMAETERILALCGGGLSQSTRADLEAVLQRRGGSITAGYTDEARDIILSIEGIASEDKVKILSRHLDCVEKLVSQPQTDAEEVHHFGLLGALERKLYDNPNEQFVLILSADDRVLLRGFWVDPIAGNSYAEVFKKICRRYDCIVCQPSADEVTNRVEISVRGRLMARQGGGFSCVTT